MCRPLSIEVRTLLKGTLLIVRGDPLVFSRLFNSTRPPCV